MAAVALIVAVVAVLISFASYRLAKRADGRAQRAEQREDRREQREVTDAQDRRRGQPVLTGRGGSGGPTAPRIEHTYNLRNGGQATITELWLWIEDASGNVVSNRAGGRMALVPGDPERPIGVEVGQPLPEGELTLMVEWTDAEGMRTESAGINPPRHH